VIKYLNYSVTFQEVPDEISLCFNITNCRFHCRGCHSPELQKNLGNDLEHDLLRIIDKYRGGITCICFLGEGHDFYALFRVISTIRHFEPELKICIYSGSDDITEFDDWIHSGLIDYIKIGSYNAKLGGLDSRTTNQHMYAVDGDALKDITSKFWRKKV